jgi:hypothetical protein
MFLIENAILSISYALIHAIRFLIKGDTAAQCKALVRLVAAPLAFTYVLGYTLGELYHRLSGRITERFA